MSRTDAPRQPSRRALMSWTGSAALVATLAGCTRGGRPTPGAASTPSGAVSSNASATSSSAALSAAPSRSSAGGAPATSVSSSTPAKATLDQLGHQLSGDLHHKDARGYDAAALLYNPRFAKQAGPQAIAACAKEADIAACVRFAADGGTGLRIRNGGHSYGGWSSGTGVVADLAAVKSVDVQGRTARIGAGALLIDVYSRLADKNLAIGAGSCPTVGVTGLTLGGGVGVLARSYGLTCDQVAAFDVVTADGKQRTVDSRHDPDLFFALRGGGGSFAAVTAITVNLHSAPTIQRFYLQWAWPHAADVVDAWQQWIATAPRELWSTCKLLGDPGSGLKATVSGTWIGSGSLGSVLGKLTRDLPGPDQDSRHTAGYGETMSAEAGCAGKDAGQCSSHALSFDVRQPFAASSSVVAKALPGAGIAAAVKAVEGGMDIGGGLVEAGMSFDALGGAIADVSSTATAFPWRTALAVVQHTATWQSSKATHDPSRFDDFVRGSRRALAPWTGSAAYVNYADASIKDFGSAYWGANLARLRTVKQHYDPHNVFSFPQAVPV